tara:strand:- start:615 stop:776 length:162 start_codon:yes stop_codon:yes gene_type:complete
MKVGDLVYDDYYGQGIILEIEFGEASIFFYEANKKSWLDKEMFASVEVISESR